MSPKKMLFSALLFSLGAAASPGAAQSAPAALQLAPRIGLYVPTADLGFVAEEEGGASLRMDRSPLLGVQLHAALPVPRLSVRGSLDYVPGTGISASRFAGYVSCGPSCHRSTYRSTPEVEGTLLLATGDLVIRPVQLRGVQPYLVGGAGIKRYSFRYSDPTDAFADLFGTTATDPALHLGAGVDVRVGSLSVTAELGDRVSRFRRLHGSSARSKGELQNDVFLLVGLRLGKLGLPPAPTR